VPRNASQCDDRGGAVTSRETRSIRRGPPGRSWAVPPVALGLLLVVTFIVMAAAGRSSASTVMDRGGEHPSSSAPSRCTGIRQQGTGHGPWQGDRSGRQGSATSSSIAATVPAVVEVVLARKQHTSLAWTNTNQAPSCGTYLWVCKSSIHGLDQPCTAGEIDRVMASDLAGRWAVGEWRRLSS